MRVLIAGACGFVGSHLAEGLQRRMPGLELYGVDNLIRPGSEVNRRILSRRVKLFHGDTRCASDFEQLPPVDWVIDAAANPSVLAGIDGRTSSRQVVEHNLLGTVNLLEFSRQSQAGLVLLSTSRVYSLHALAGLPVRVENEAFVLDETQPLPEGVTTQGIGESFSTAAPVSLYGGTKLASEGIALEYGHAFRLPVAIDRCGVLAGPRQFGTAEQGIFSYWIGSYGARRPLRYIGFHGTGHQVRDALHPDDLAEMVWRQLRQPSRAAGIWNIGGGIENAMSLRQLSRWCEERYGTHSISADERPRPSDTPWIVIDSSTARKAFDWRPSIPLPQILDAIDHHYREHPEWLEISEP